MRGNESDIVRDVYFLSEVFDVQPNINYLTLIFPYLIIRNQEWTS